MYKIIGKSTIQISRGDYALIPLRIIGADSGEEIVFSISKYEDPTEVLFQQATVIDGDMAFITLSQEVTKKFQSGNYYWDVFLPHFWADNERHTPQTPKLFQILGVSHVV
jgi:hypothetical protein